MELTIVPIDASANNPNSAVNTVRGSLKRQIAVSNIEAAAKMI